MKKVLVICGPTASGKSDLAIECAKLLNSEIISADSMNVYARLNIGTAKPTIEDQRLIKHHMIDVVQPSDSFSVGDYRDLALPIVNNLVDSGKIPVICGGTGFYINSLLYKMSYGNGCANYELREELKKLAQEKGNQEVYKILQEKDPESAKVLHPNDLKRVIRALEIFYNGTKKSEIKDDKTPIFDYSAYSFDYSTEALYDRINLRVDEMVNNGLIDEVKSLLFEGVLPAYQCMQGIGYKEVIPYLENKIDLQTCIDTIKLNTRHYAKRQKTFFKRLPNLQYLIPNDNKLLAKLVVDKL